ncbi:MAG: anaerobic ribonucleoside-triphosphate reductase activating protein [Spirochaetales bacterium]|nr:anaerobic ribonucleoside-triphosphate reductase activating protein [Spirochaetales bacterium]
MKYGLLKTTLLDYPGKVASVLFTGGCNLRCPYCHNPELVHAKEDSNLLSGEEIGAFLKKRASVLGGVVITGGEPLLHGEEIIAMIDKIHSLGLPVKVDTNGLFPELLPKLKADFIAMDLKTSPSRYGELGCRVEDYVGKLTRSARWIIDSGVEHQFRTTLSEELITAEDVDAMVPLLRGCKEHRITPFRPGKTLSPDWETKQPPSGEYVKMIEQLFINNKIPSYTA